MGDDLREQIAAHLRYMRERHAAFDGPLPTDDFMDADDLIRSAPALQRLVEQAAEAARLRAVVARAEEIAHRLPYLGVGEAWNRALDGTDG